MMRVGFVPHHSAAIKLGKLLNDNSDSSAISVISRTCDDPTRRRLRLRRRRSQRWSYRSDHRGLEGESVVPERIACQTSPAPALTIAVNAA
jgi:hypothetical protein